MAINKQEVLISFKKANGLILKIVEMIENDDYCIDVMHQNLAAMGLLKSAQRMLMEKHLNSCFKKAMDTASEKKKQEMIDEILQLIKLKKG